MKMTGHLKKGNVRLCFLWFLWVLLLTNIHCFKNNLGDFVNAEGPPSRGGGPPPETPQGFKAVASEGQVTLTWNSQPDVVYYLFYSQTAGIDVGDGTNITGISNVISPYTHEGLMSGTTYYYRLTATNSWGASEPTDEVSTRVPGSGIPAKPETPTTTASEGQITLEWIPQENVIYHLYHSTSAGVDIQSGTNVMRISNVTPPYPHTDLMSGTTYYYRLRAVNSSGASEPSDEVSATTPGPGTPPVKPPPPAPMASEGQITLTWTSQPGVSYHLYHSTSAGIDPEDGTNVMRISNVTSPYAHQGLMSGTTYYYRLTAVNSFGASEPSDETSAGTPGPSTAPAKPQNFTAAASSGQVTLTWTSQPGVVYHLYHSTSAGIDPEGGTNVMRISNVRSPYPHTGLMSGTTYYYRLTAVNSLGASPPADEVSATTPGSNAAPAKPQNFTAAASSGQVTLTWTSQPGVIYHLYHSTSAGIDPESGTNVMRISNVTSPHVHTGLMSGTTYYYRLTANNASGASPPADEVSATTPGPSTAPAKPQNFIAVSSEGQVTLTWTPQPGVIYHLYHSTSSGIDVGSGTNVMRISNVTSPHVHTGLRSGTTYYYRLTANNALGASPPADEASATTSGPSAPPAKPGTLTTMASEGQITLTWASQSGVTYELYHSTSAGIDVEGGTNVMRISNVTSPHVHTGLMSGTTYYYRLTANNALGASPPADEVSATTPGPSAPPAKPQKPTAAASSGQVTLTWTPQPGVTYNLFYSKTEGFDIASGTNIMGALNVTSPYTLTGLVNATTYYYRLRAVNSLGASPPADEVSATPQVQVTVRMSGAGAWLNGITHASGKFVVVGGVGTILTSSDGITWTSRTSGTGNALSGITHGGGKFVAVGGSGTILTSSDGITWTSRTSSTSQWLQDVTHGGGKFVAVGDNGTILTSSDGTTWTSRTSGTNNRLFGTTYGGGQFVAVGGNGTILTSSDGTTWTLQQKTDPATMTMVNYTSQWLQGVTHEGGQFVAVGGNGAILTSSDGITWTSQNPPSAFPTINLKDIIHAGSQFVAVGGSGYIIKSSNATAWTSQRIAENDFADIVHGANQFVVVGDGGIFTSADADTWSPRSNFLEGITHGAGQFVAVGQDGRILTSPNGIIWTSQTSGILYNLQDITHGGGQFVAVGQVGEILTSPNGIIWTRQTSGTANSLNDITHGGGQFVTVGRSGTILTSSDGITWTSRTSGTSQWLQDVTHGGGKFVAVGDNGIILTSSDGITWVLQQKTDPATMTMVNYTTNQLRSVTHGGGKFVAVGPSGTILTSNDGITWTSRTSGTNRWLYGITHAGGQFVVVGEAGTILTSRDSINWKSLTSPTNNRLRGITYADGQFVIVAWDTILTAR